MRLGSIVLAGALAGCVIAPPQPPPPVPLVAVPGPTKTETAFRQDDLTCRVAAVQLPAEPGTLQAATPAAAPGAAPAANPAPVGEPIPPGVTYLRCMVARNNLVQPMAATPPAVYGYYASYPIYAGFGDTYPWLYGDFVGLGFYGGYGGFYGGGFGGGYRRYGFGEGFHGGPFHDGGFRGGGFNGGGFHGGGFGGGGFHGGGFGGRR